MTDDSPAEKAEAKAIRRRWITIGEGVAVAGVLIAGLTFWSGYQDRRDAAEDREFTRRAEAAEQGAARHRVTIVAVAADRDGIEFKAQAGCALQMSRIAFPSALGVEPQDTVITHRIEADWIAKRMLKLTDGGADRRDGRLPVLIEAGCTAVDGDRDETAIYDLLWRTGPGGIFGGRSFTLRGLIRRQSGGDQRRLDALWTGV
ncbi:hypothetical protein [Sphingomonas sp.]|uniref:hypothetical protein n=1 Tax=Sphingomonas sp. TaxID=28214 RepID=UPI002DD63098|nr:hypothetical protein [Sphingomonas sp.]